MLPTFALDADNLKFVARICRLVQGMPLGILLAAAWVDALTLPEINQEIEKSLDFLETDQRDIPARQRSLRATFDYSWNLLTGSECDVFKNLSMFWGGFTREAAQQVAGASLKTLIVLVNKSLLRRDASTGRYDIHELLRQYGEAQLNASPQGGQQTHDLHCKYYADYMRQQWKALMSLRQGAVLDEIGVEFNNVLEAWNYAVGNRNAAILRDMAFSLWYFCDLRTPHPEAEVLFRRAAEALQSVLANKETEIVLGHMLARQGWFSDSLPRALHGKALIEKSLVILRKHDCPEERVIALDCLAVIAGYVLGQFAEGLLASQEGLRIARENHILWGIGHCLMNVAYHLWAQKNFIQARQIGEECQRASEAIGDVLMMAVNAVFVLGPVAIDLQDYGEAERQFEQGLPWFNDLERGIPWHSAVACAHLAEVALLTYDYEQVNYWLHQTLHYHKQSGRQTQAYDEALCDLSRLFAAQGRHEDAGALLSLVQHHTQHQHVRELATVSLGELQAALPDEIYAAVVERGKSLNLDAVLDEFLTE